MLNSTLFKGAAACFFMLTVFSAHAKSELIVKSPAQTENSILLIWNSALSFAPKTCDYVVYLNGKKCSVTARQQVEQTNLNVYAYKEAFYQHFTKEFTGLQMIETDVTYFELQNLEPDTTYEVYVTGVNKKGRKTVKSATVTFTTKSASGTCSGTPSGILDVTSFGAVNGDKIIDVKCSGEERALIKSNTAAIQKAIDECPKNGTVYIPNGIFMSGGLHLKSDMTLKIDGTLCASPFAEDYDYGFLMYTYYTDKRRWGLLSCDGAQNLTLCGKGCVDGNGWLFYTAESIKDNDWCTYAEEGDLDFYKNKSKARQLIRFKKGNKKTVYTDGILAADCAYNYLNSIGKNPENATSAELGEAYATRSTTVILRGVKNLLIKDLLFINPANHMINIIDSTNVTVTGITELTYDCNNGDGIGLICTDNAVVYNNFIDAGDDCIVFSAGVGKPASTTGQSGVKNVQIFGNYIHHGHGGVAFGSHTALGISDVQIYDNIFNHTDAPFRIKSAPANGGFVRDVLFEHNSITCAKQPFIMSTEYNDAGTVSKYGPADKPAVFSNITCRDSTVFRVGGTTIYISAADDSPHSNIFFKNVKFAKPGNMGEYIKNCNNYKNEE